MQNFVLISLVRNVCTELESKKMFHDFIFLFPRVCLYSGGGEGSGWGAFVGPPAGWSVGVGWSADGDH